MNKSKKLAFAAVAVVMAGAMAASIAGCKDKDNNKNDLSVKLDANNQLTYAAGTTIKTALGYNSNVTGIKYDTTQIQKVGGSSASNMTYAGKTYVSGDLKPAWQSLTSTLGINVVDEWAGSKDVEAGKHISYLKQNNKLGEYSLITASATTILGEDSGTWLDINKYLDYMPNYKKFLEENAVTRMSVTANTNTGAMYMVPYFDGNNDIEKYVLMRKDIVEKILDTTDLTAATGTFASQADTKNKSEQKGQVTVVGTSHSVESFMGKTAADNYTIKVTDPAALRAADTAAGELSFGNNLSYITETNKNDTVELTVDYGAVIVALQDSSSALYQAAAAPLGSTAVQTASGNIIDIQNQMIDVSNGAVTGAQLTKVLQEYIKVAYHKTGESTPFYSKLSDVFNSAYAAWDVDLYVAFGRASMASSGLLGESSKGEGAYLLASRTGYTNRTYDIASMAGELYGVRGLTSRYNSLYAYIDKEGNIKDARNETAYWNALENMSKLAKEGLYYTGIANKDGYLTIANKETNPNIQVYSSTDYVQTQTRLAGYAVDGKLKNIKIEEGYNYAPILTPVSRWDVNGDGTAEEVMRFTESWRGVKDGGLCIPKAAVSGNPDKLSATLKVIDWMFSNDGQIVMTYGPFSKAGNITREQGKNENADYGTWYGKPADKTLEQAKTEGIVETVDNVQYRVKAEYQGLYFCFENKLYSGTYYNGKQVPTTTDEVMTELMEINEGKFTDHARQYIGSALNFGNKDQGFEAQCTPTCGLVGANIWAIAKNNGTIVHTIPGLTNDAKYGYWLTLVPTVLPFTDAQTSAMKTNYQKVSGFGSSSSDNYFYANSSAKGNILTDIMYFGFDTSKEFTGVGGAIPGNAQGIIALLNTNGMQQVDGYMETAWGKIKTYYTANLNK